MFLKPSKTVAVDLQSLIFHGFWLSGFFLAFYLKPILHNYKDYAKLKYKNSFNHKKW